MATTTNNKMSQQFNVSSFDTDIQRLLKQHPEFMRYAHILEEAARSHNTRNLDNIIDVNAEIRRTHHESRFNPKAVGSDGVSLGIAQITNTTAAAMNIDPFDPEAALKAQITISAQNQSQYNNDPILTSVAYNAGPRAINFVAKKLNIPTRNLTGEQWIDFMEDRRESYRAEHADNGNNGIVAHAWHEVTLDYVHALHIQPTTSAQATPKIDELLTQDAPFSQADIKELQSQLRNAGFRANARPDGIMGPNTRSDIAAYLQENPSLIASTNPQIMAQLLNSDFSHNGIKAKLIQSVQNDPKTLKALRNEVTDILGSRELSELSKAEISAVQKNWQLLGDYPTNFKIDGKIGNGTRSALTKHQNPSGPSAATAKPTTPPPAKAEEEAKATGKEISTNSINAAWETLEGHNTPIDVQTTPDARPFVVIDLGHGTKGTKHNTIDRGALGIETNITDPIGAAIADALQKMGFDTAFTREPNSTFRYTHQENIQSLSSRQVRGAFPGALSTVLGNPNYMQITLHADSNTSTQSLGTRIYAASADNNDGKVDLGRPAINPFSLKLAESISSSLGDYGQPSSTADISLTQTFEKVANKPDANAAVLIEIGNLRNIDDLKNMKSWRDDPQPYALKIAQGIRDYYEAHMKPSIEKDHQTELSTNTKPAEKNPAAIPLSTPQGITL